MADRGYNAYTNKLYEQGKIASADLLGKCRGKRLIIAKQEVSRKLRPKRLVDAEQAGGLMSL